MKKWFLIGIITLALYLVIGDRDESQESQHVEQPDSHALDESSQNKRDSTNLHTSSDTPSLPDHLPRVVIEDGPKRPGEGHGPYRVRIKLAQTFEAFRIAAELSDEQTQALLLALYDFQRNNDALMRDSVYEDRFDEVPQRESNRLLDDYLNTWTIRQESILSDWQMEVWIRVCGSCLLYARDGALRLETDVPGKDDDLWWR